MNAPEDTPADPPLARRAGTHGDAPEALGGALGGRKLLAARVAWLAVCALAVALFVVDLPLEFGALRTVCSGARCLGEQLGAAEARELAEAGVSPTGFAAYRVALMAATALVYCAVGALIFWLRSEEPMPLLASLFLVTFSTGAFWGNQGAVASHPLLGPPQSFEMYVGDLSFFLFVFLFPNGRFVPRWTRWLMVPWAVIQFDDYLLSGRLLDLPDSVGLALFLGLFLVPGVFSQIYRYRRVSGPEQRQQTKWAVFGIAAALLVPTAVGLPLLLLGELGPAVSPLSLAYDALYAASFLLIPLSIGAAILRYRLWDIDVVINRAIVYGALTACVAGLYVLVVGGLGAVLQAGGDLAVSLLATGLVAVLFAPLRDRLQRAANHLMYGERDDPYAVLSRLGRRLEGVLAPEAALDAVCDAVVQALKAPYATIELVRGGDVRMVAESGSPMGEAVSLPLAHQGETVGRLVVSPRSPGEGFSSQDRTLLEDLARQAGAAAYAARLEADLQRSRERLVNAREEERRRLRRDLHDGLGPTLGGLTLGVDAARGSLARGDAGATDPLLRELANQSQEAVSDVRRLVDGLRPPALDDLGLVPAIRQQAAKRGALGDESNAAQRAGRTDERGEPVFRVEAPECLPPLPAAAEVACYRIAQEAINNVARHSGAGSCEVRLRTEEGGGALVLEVSDDGVGVREERVAGVGTTSMRERAEELGGTLTIEAVREGGTRVTARLPLPARGGRPG